jgi:hypothetical protein
MAGKHELHEKGLRLTPQRELVLSAVRALGHATPEEVAEKVRQTHPGINLSTVYRNLETLENVGMVELPITQLKSSLTYTLSAALVALWEMRQLMWQLTLFRIYLMTTALRPMSRTLPSMAPALPA